jgi:hypothetical protein
MDYEQLVTAMWKLNRRKRLGNQVCATALWLVDLWSRNGRSEWFPCTQLYIQEETGASRGTVKRVLNTLTEQKLLTIVQRGQKVPSIFSIVPMVKTLSGLERGQNELSNRPLSEESGQNKGTTGFSLLDARARSTATSIATLNKDKGEATSAREPSPPPTKKPRLFISELKSQRECLGEQLNELAYLGHEDAMGIHYRPEDRPKVRELKNRMKDVRNQIANYGC